MTVERTFNASRERVWDAWTTANLLEQWWAPKPWVAVTKDFDFREGGHWHYFMQGPDNTKIWSWVSYDNVDPKQSFDAQDSFCDEHGNTNRQMPSTNWHNEFRDEGAATVVRTTLTFPTLADMDKILSMGFEDGFSMALNNLNELIAQK